MHQIKVENFNNDNKLTLLIRDRELNSVDLFKYVGVHVDYSLIWKDNLTCVTSNMSRGIGMLKQAKKFCLPKILLFEYCEALLSVLLLCFGEPAVLLKKAAFKNFTTERLELSPTANLML